MPAVRRALVKATRAPTPDPVWDVLIVGSGVLGSALAFAAVARGLKTVVVSRELGSESFRYGEAFTLNTWSRPPQEETPPGSACEQHPGLIISPRALSRAEFIDASVLRDLALCTLWASGASLVRAEAGRVSSSSPLVMRVTGSHRLRAHAVIACPGFTQPVVRIAHQPSAARVRRALEQGSKRVLGFQQLAKRCVSDPLAAARLGRHVIVVGSGPSALSALELIWRASDSVRVTWLTGPEGPTVPFDAGRTSAAGVSEMFDRRYAAMRARALHRARDGWLTMHTGAVDRVRLTAQQVELAIGNATFRGDCLIWCGGMTGDFTTVDPHAPLVVDGVSLGIQREEAGRRWPVFGVGPALDSLGLGDWPTGPYSEWVRKGLTLIARLHAPSR